MRNVCLAAGLNEIEMATVDRHLTGKEHDNDDFIDTTAYEKLFDYFCFQGLMPYHIAKARTGEPDVWILEQLAVMSKTDG